MNSHAKSFYAAGALFAFVGGLVPSLVAPFDAIAPPRDVLEFLRESPPALVMAGILIAAGSGVAIRVAVRFVRSQTVLERLVLKIFVLASPAIAIGLPVGLALRFLCFNETPVTALVQVLGGSIAYMIAGIVGMATMKGMPEYEEIDRSKPSEEDKDSRGEADDDTA